MWVDEGDTILQMNTPSYGDQVLTQSRIGSARLYHTTLPLFEFLDTIVPVVSPANLSTEIFYEIANVYVRALVSVRQFWYFMVENAIIWRVIKHKIPQKIKLVVRQKARLESVAQFQPWTHRI